MRRLLLANVVLAGLLAGHIADHVYRQTGPGISAAAGIPGLFGAAAAVVSLGLATRGSRFAPSFGVLVGIATALGFAAIHLAPHWSLFSDPYYDRHLDAVSWTEMLVTLGAGLYLAATAMRAHLISTTYMSDVTRWWKLPATTGSSGSRSACAVCAFVHRTL